MTAFNSSDTTINIVTVLKMVSRHDVRLRKYPYCDEVSDGHALSMRGMQDSTVV